MKAMMMTEDLKRIIKSTAKFISKDENRPMLQYIRLDFNRENFTVNAVALDGMKISTESAKCNHIDESFTAYIKPYLPIGAKGEYSIIEMSGQACLIEIDGRIAGYKQPSGAQLNIGELVKNLESTPAKFKIGFDYGMLLDALRSIQKENKKIKNEPIIMEFREACNAVLIKTKNGIKGIMPVRI